MAKKDTLKEQIDRCLHSLVDELFTSYYGKDWFTNVLVPHMREFSSTENEENSKLVQTYQGFMRHNSNFNNADTTFCAGILLHDPAYKRMIDDSTRRRIFSLRDFRNECSHNRNDISDALYNDGIVAVEQMNRFVKSVSTQRKKTKKAKSGKSVVRCRKKMNVKKVVTYFLIFAFLFFFGFIAYQQSEIFHDIIQKYFIESKYAIVSWILTVGFLYAVIFGRKKR